MGSLIHFLILRYLVKTNTGEPYVLYSGGRNFTFGTIDLANPDARVGDCFTSLFDHM